MLDTGVGDQDVDRLEFLEGTCEKIADVLFAADIGLNVDGVAATGANRLDDTARLVFAAGVVDDNIGAGRGECPGDAFPNSRTGAGHNCGLVDQWFDLRGHGMVVCQVESDRVEHVAEPRQFDPRDTTAIPKRTGHCRCRIDGGQAFAVDGQPGCTSSFTRWFFVLLVTSVLIATPDAGLLAQEAQPSDADRAELQQQVRSLTDKTIQLAIEKELLASHAVDGSLIVVQVEDGIVKLSGRVEHLLAEDVAISLVQRIRGVVSVVDLIEVEAQRRPDADLKKDVEAAIGADPATHDVHPTVSVVDGVVSLTGAVATFGEKSLIEQVVKRVTGVLEVKNDLVNARSKDVSDDELRKEIGELYQYAVLLDDAKIDVDVSTTFLGSSMVAARANAL